MKREQLRINNLKKGHMLKDIHFAIFREEITHIVFDNVQSKALFLRIMSGWEQPDFGRFYYNEEEIPFSELREKIALITNECQLIDYLSIAENIFLMREKVRARKVDFHFIENKTQQLFEELGIELNIHKNVSKLTDYEKMEIELSKAYSLKKQVIFITGFGNLLSQKEVIKLQGIIQRLKGKEVTVVYVEPLENIDFSFCDRVVVVKNGRVCITKEAEECDYTLLHRCLYQNEYNRIDYEKVAYFSENADSERVMIHNFTSDYLKMVSISIYRGEIVKLFCADEKSMYEIINIVRGRSRILNGYFISKQSRNLSECTNPLAAGIGIVEGNPAKINNFSEMRVMDNLFIMLSHKISGIWMNKKFRKSSQIMLEGIVPENLYRKKIKKLSPVEQQKVLYSKWLLYAPELLICIQPFSDGNIQAREAAREMIYVLKNRNIPILIVTSSMSEINYCGGRMCYMYHGRLISKEEFEKHKESSAMSD